MPTCMDEDLAVEVDPLLDPGLDPPDQPMVKSGEPDDIPAKAMRLQRPFNRRNA